jgi:hypothetical protein
MQIVVTEFRIERKFRDHVGMQVRSGEG